MASVKKESRYSPVEKVSDFDHDLENDSDTTLASTGFLSKPSSSKRPSKTSRKNAQMLVWARWGAVITMQAIMCLLLVRSRTPVWKSGETETGGDVNGLYIPSSHKYTYLDLEKEKFVPNMTSDENRMEVRRNWDMLMPLGSGSVLIPDYEKYPMLGKPIDDDPIHTGPIFEASWTHALHCLYYTVDSYHQLTISGGQKFGFDGERNDAHASHCFEYIRTQLLCMADMTLEGAPSVLGSKDGQGHMCRNMDEAKAWIEERRVDDIQSIVGP